MKEVQFLQRNSKKWKNFEANINSSITFDSDEKAEIFVEILDDLAYAKTYFPNTKTHKYLNALSSKVQQNLYKNKRENWKAFKNYFKIDLPKVYLKVQKELLISLIIFSFGVLIGLVSSLNDDSFLRLILGDGYVNMTEANIESGNPMAVYDSSNELNMFFGITFNNVMVSFYAFILGIFFTIGTAYVIFSNSIMLGAFHGFFIKHDLFWETFLTVWIHGSLELSAIVIAGAAGFVLGRSFMYPGSYKRNHSFIEGGRNGVRMILGLVPVFIMAGFLESFVTRYHEMPIVIKLIIIISSLSWVAWYFVIYPRNLSKKGII